MVDYVHFNMFYSGIWGGQDIFYFVIYMLGNYWLSLKELVLNPIFSAARSNNALSSGEILTSIESDFLALMLLISKTIPLPAFIVYTIIAFPV